MFQGDKKTRMSSSIVGRTVVALGIAALAANLSWSADDARAKAPTASTTRSGPARSSSAKGPLPDPALLDGSTQQPEKKSEQGMIGDFELPGDENVRDGKVGGPQNQNPASRGGQSSNTPMGMPQAGGGGGPQSQQQQGGGAQAQQGAQQAGGAQAGGPENPNAAGNPVAGAGDPGAQPQGQQVAQLGGDASAQGAGAAGGPGEKPPPVAIGDSAMRIEPSAAVAGVVGAQQQQPAGNTQQHEKGTGSGGKGSGGSQGGNRVEKGRTIPSGL
jgi:hypothetical protein